MCRTHSVARLFLTMTLASIGGACGTSDPQKPSAAPAATTGRLSHQDWPTGHYKVVEGWPKPLPDTRHSHDGWTWGSFGGVYAENPDRIWIAMRGELPLPKGATPWTPYVALNPPLVATGNADGLSPTCEPVAKRGWERRFQHSILIVDGQGNLVDEWSHLNEMFDKLPCGRGPHQIKISPYDKEKHVWIIDDQLHMIYRFTYDGKLVHSKGELGKRGGAGDGELPPLRTAVPPSQAILRVRETGPPERATSSGRLIGNSRNRPSQVKGSVPARTNQAKPTPGERHEQGLRKVRDRDREAE